MQSIPVIRSRDDSGIPETLSVYRIVSDRQPGVLIGNFTLGETANFLGVNRGWLGFLLSRNQGRWSARGYFVVRRESRT
jgi:hypothetical protein